MFYTFEIRSRLPGLEGVRELIAHERFGTPLSIVKTTGKVRAWTAWSARRYIRKMFGAELIEIVRVERDKR